jgi:hypothetical protein
LVTLADVAARKQIGKEAESRKLKSLLPQLWSLSRPAALLLSGWLGKRAVLLIPGVAAGALSEALLVAFIVFALYVAWERAGYRISGREGD